MSHLDSYGFRQKQCCCKQCLATSREHKSFIFVIHRVRVRASDISLSYKGLSMAYVIWQPCFRQNMFIRAVTFYLHHHSNPCTSIPCCPTSNVGCCSLNLI